MPDELTHKMVDRRAGVMFEARQAEIDARRVEQRQRTGRVDGEIPAAIGNLVADVNQLAGWKPAAQFGNLDTF